MKINGKKQESSIPSSFLRKGYSELWFAPDSDNHVLIEKLIARFKEHKQPGHLIDVLTIGEVLAVYNYMKYSIENRALVNSSWYLQDQLFKALLAALPWLAYEEEQQELRNRSTNPILVQAG